MQRKYLNRSAIIPSMPWIDANPPLYPSTIRIEDNMLSWEPGAESDPLNTAQFFVIYRFKPGDNPHIKRADRIVCITGQTRYKIEHRKDGSVYRVTALDRVNNESLLSSPVTYN
jgi:hypothetical protein